MVQFLQYATLTVTPVLTTQLMNLPMALPPPLQVELSFVTARFLQQAKSSSTFDARAIDNLSPSSLIHTPRLPSLLSQSLFPSQLLFLHEPSLLNQPSLWSQPLLQQSQSQPVEASCLLHKLQLLMPCLYQH